MKKDSNLVTKVEGEDTVLDVTTIKDASETNMCKIQVTNVDIPDDIINAGFKFESYCCVKFDTDNGFMHMCNPDKPRCWYNIRRFARLMRLKCLKDHLTKAGMPIDATLAKEK